MTIYKTAELNVCEDCFSNIVTGDNTGLDYHYSPEEAESVLALIQDGERDLMVQYGQLLPMDEGCERDTTTSGCDCCGRFRGVYRDDYKLGAYTPATKTENPGTNIAFDRLLNPFVLDVSIQELGWQKQGLSYTASGYGSKIPTRYVLHCADGKTRRVYCTIYSNVGSLWVTYNGKLTVLDTDIEIRLQELEK